MEIEFSEASEGIKALVKRAEEFGVKEYLYPRAIVGRSKTFVVFIPPCVNGDVDAPDNIYIDDDFWGDVGGEFTLSYGFSHVHFDTADGDEAAIQMVKDIIEHNVVGYHLRILSKYDLTGYIPNYTDEELKVIFTERAKQYGSELKEDFVRICYWNETELKTIKL